MTVVVHGVPEAIAKFIEIGVVGNLGAEVAVKQIAADVAQSAIGLVPVDTGELQSSIGITEEGVEAGTDHAFYVEFGTSVMAAEPFMRPAADQADLESPMVVLAAAIEATGIG